MLDLVLYKVVMAEDTSGAEGLSIIKHSVNKAIKE